MKSDSIYQNLDYLIHAYFNQDFDSWGNTMEEIVSCFRKENDEALCRLIVTEIDRFEAEHSGDLDACFDRAYGLYVNPLAWGHTVHSFLEELKHLLAE